MDNGTKEIIREQEVKIESKEGGYEVSIYTKDYGRKYFCFTTKDEAIAQAKEIFETII